MVDDKLKESEGEQLLKKFTEGKYNELVDEIEKLTKEYEDSPFAYSLLGNALFNLKNFKDSIKAFEKEIKVSEEEHFLPYYNLGRNYEMLNNSELEISNYLKSFTLNPKKFETNYNLGMAYQRIEEYDNAEKYLTNAHILKKDEPMAIINLLALLFKLKKYSLGIEFASQANEEFEKHFQYCYNYALLLYETKRIEESNIMNEKGMANMQKGNNPIFLDSLGLKTNILNAQLKNEESINVSFEILKNDQNHYLALKSLVKSYAHLGNHRASIFFNRLADGNIRFEIKDNGNIDLFLHHKDKISIDG